MLAAGARAESAAAQVEAATSSDALADAAEKARGEHGEHPASVRPGMCMVNCLKLDLM